MNTQQTMISQQFKTTLFPLFGKQSVSYSENYLYVLFLKIQTVIETDTEKGGENHVFIVLERSYFLKVMKDFRF